MTIDKCCNICYSKHMIHTPEEPFNRQNDPEYIQAVMGLYKEKMNEVIDEDAKLENQLLEFDVLRFAAQTVINPHDEVAVDEWKLAQFKLNFYRRVHPAPPPLEIVREDG